MMDGYVADDGTPSAGSPEVRNVLSDPLGIADPRANSHADISFEEASEAGDHGHYNKATHRFE